MQRGIPENNQFDVIRIDTLNNAVPKYSKVELGIKLDVTTQAKINNFLDVISGLTLNPYDPDQIKIVCHFINISTNNLYDRNAFYYSDFHVIANSWIKDINPYNFRVRFCPPEVGNYQYGLDIVLNNQLYASSSYPSYFTVVPSGNHGYLIMDPNPTRKLKFEDGTTFFALAQNFGHDPGSAIPYNCNDKNSWTCMCPALYLNDRVNLNDFADNYGNFTRIVIGAGGFPVEWPPTTIGSLTGDLLNTAPVINYLNNYDNNQKYMWELDQIFATMERRGIYAILALMNDQNFCNNNPYDWTSNEEWSWPGNPYSGLLGNTPAGCQNFFSDAQAKIKYKKYLDYVMARWGSSTSLAAWEEINETENVAINAANSNITRPYVADAMFKSIVNDWVREMKWHLEVQYPWHPTTTGLSDDLNELNFWTSNDYTNYSYNGLYLNRDFRRFKFLAEDYFPNYKPFVWGELGVGDAANDIDKGSDRPFHNANWTSVVSGAFGTGMYYNDFQNLWRTQGYNSINHRLNFKALSAFVNMIDWNTIWIPYTKPLGDNGTQANNKTIYTFNSYSSDGKAIAWAVNNSSNWINEGETAYNFVDPHKPPITDPNDFYYHNNYRQLLFIMGMDPHTVPNKYDIDDSSQLDPKIIIDIPTGIFNAMYRVDVYKTYGDGGLIKTIIVPLSGMQLIFSMTMPHDINTYPTFGYPDYAFIATPIP